MPAAAQQRLRPAKKKGPKGRAKSSKKSFGQLLKLIEKRIGYKFQERSFLVRLAITHPSADPDQNPEFRRLALLGQNALLLVANEMLFKKFPNAPEGFLDSYRQLLMKKSSVVTYGKAVKVDSFMETGTLNQLGLDNMRRRVFQALLGVAMLDGQIDAVKQIAAPILARAMGQHKLRAYPAATPPRVHRAKSGS